MASKPTKKPAKKAAKRQSRFALVDAVKRGMDVDVAATWVRGLYPLGLTRQELKRGGDYVLAYMARKGNGDQESQ